MAPDEGPAPWYTTSNMVYAGHEWWEIVVERHSHLTKCSLEQGMGGVGVQAVNPFKVKWQFHMTI